MVRPVPSLELLRRIKALRDRGLGWRRIVKELNLGVSYRTIARWLKKYEGFLNGVKVTQNPKTAVTSDHYFMSREPEDRPVDFVEDPSVWRRLGRTEKLILSVMATDPYAYWTSTLILKGAGLMRYKLSRNAVWAALKRLQKRGLINYSPMVTLFAGAVFRGAYSLRPVFNDSVAVHNLKVPGPLKDQCVVCDDSSVPLSAALFRGNILYGDVPITQAEMNSDYPMSDGVLNYLKSLGWGMTVIYPKPELGVIRFEHRLNPKDLLLNLRSKDELEFRYKVLTKIAYDIVTTETVRMNSEGINPQSSDRRGGACFCPFSYLVEV